MADSLQSKYKGFIILNKEIGPIELEVDTSAKTVTGSVASPYAFAGGGGGVPYILEPTSVTLNELEHLYPINPGKITDLYEDTTMVWSASLQGVFLAGVATYSENDNTVTCEYEGNAIFSIVPDNDLGWCIDCYENSGTLTVALVEQF